MRLLSLPRQRFGQDLNHPRSPADVPGYKTPSAIHDEAMNIVYVEYDVSGSKGSVSASPE